MTQHPFDREFSQQDIAKLNAFDDERVSFKELTEEETKQISGGGCDHFIHKDIKKIDPPKGVTTMALGEEGGEPY